MSILDNMRLVKKELFHQKHPLAKEALHFRQTYAVGYAMLLCVNGHPSEIVKDVFKKQLSLMDLPTEYYKLAIQTAMRAEVDMIHTVLEELQQPAQKYLFMLDLYQYAQNDHKITEKEQELLVLFEELLQLSYSEVQFIRGFRLAMLKKDVELAGKVVQAAFEQKIEIPLDALSYFLPSFVYQEKWGHTTLMSGQKRKLSYAALLTGDLIVSKGAELDLNGMTVTFANNASIIVDGGVLKADGARFIASMDASKTMLSVRNVNMLKLTDAYFFGANNVRAIELSNTQSELEGCSFEKCFDEERGGAVYFAGSDHFVVKHCSFEHNTTLGKGGALYVAGTEASHMKAREFFNRVIGHAQKVNMVLEGSVLKESRAEIGGAMYMYDVVLRMSGNTFEQCTSTTGGGAIDIYNGEVSASDNIFSYCKTMSGEATVVMNHSKTEKDLQQIGKFEHCEPKEWLIK